MVIIIVIRKGDTKEMITKEEKINRIKQLRIIDDVMFEVVARNKEVCEEILQTILEDKKLVVNDVITQASVRNLYGRSVRLDALCTLGNGTKCNIEVQRSDNDDHVKRVRFNASSITVKDSTPNDRFSDVVELYVVYISEFDIFGDGLTVYHVDKMIRENHKVVDDGLHEIFVNTAIDDGSEIAELMKCFVQKDVNNPRFPKTSDEVNKLKSTEGGLRFMCELIDELFDEERKYYEEKLAKQAAEKDAELARKVAEKDAEIASLRAKLAEK